MELWTNLTQSLLNLFLKTPCALCQRLSAACLCDDCQRQLQRCQLQPTEQWIPGQLPLLSWGAYSGELKQALAQLKYNNQPQLAQPLGYRLGQAWLASPLAKRLKTQKSPLSRPVAIPIPLHASRKRQRGYNQAELLAQSFCQVTRLPLQRQGLTRIRATEAQFGLSAAARQQNLSCAFRPSQKLLQQAPARAILLDDIYTTGATARSAAQTLHHFNIEVYSIVTVAKTLAQKSRD